MHRRPWAIELVVIGLFVSSAAAQDETGPDPIQSVEAEIQDDGANLAADVKQAVPFGRRGSERIMLSAGIASERSSGSDVQPVALAYSSFIDDGVELLAEAGTWYFDQEGDNALGVSLSLGARWHAVNRSNWSLFVDVGLGALVATDNVPAGGTGLNFMPRLGAGGTIAIGDTGCRAVIGLRGHHISNARIFGDVSNPSRDAPMIYVGVSFPF